jgi:hypothetical protein
MTQPVNFLRHIFEGIAHFRNTHAVAFRWSCFLQQLGLYMKMPFANENFIAVDRMPLIPVEPTLNDSF